MTEETWIDAVPEEYKGVAAKYENPGELAKAYQELQLFRGKSLTIPGDDASAGEQTEFYEKVMERVPGLVRKPASDDPEAVANYWKSMGKPENADGYAALDGMTPEQTSFMRDAALKANLTNDQFKQFAGVFNEKQLSEGTAAAEMAKSELDAIHQSLGAAKDQKLQAVNNLANQLEMDEGLKDFNNPKVLGLMLKLVDKVGSEGSAMQEQIGDQASAVMTPLEAEQKIGELMDRVFSENVTPQEKNALMKRVVQLESYANPGASTTMASQRAGFGSTSSATRDTIF